MLQTSSHCPVAKSGCSEKTDWDRSVGTHKTLLRQPLHQDMGLSYQSPFKRLNWCRVNKQTVKEMAEVLIPFYLFPLLLVFPLPQFWALVASPGVLKQQSSKDCWSGPMLGSIFSRYDCLFQGGGGGRQVEGNSSVSAIINPHQPPGSKRLKSFLITEGRAYNKQCGITAWEAQILSITSKFPELPHQNNYIIKADETRAFQGGQSWRNKKVSRERCRGGSPPSHSVWILACIKYRHNNKQ